MFSPCSPKTLIYAVGLSFLFRFSFFYYILPCVQQQVDLRGLLLSLSCPLSLFCIFFWSSYWEVSVAGTWQLQRANGRLGCQTTAGTHDRSEEKTREMRLAFLLAVTEYIAWHLLEEREVSLNSWFPLDYSIMKSERISRNESSITGQQWASSSHFQLLKVNSTLQT